MKKKIVLTSVISILVIIVLLILYIYKTPSLVSRKDDIIKVSVSSLPEGFSYSFDGESADAIVEYLSNIELISKFKKNPDRYLGIVWVISLEYNNSDISTVYQSGNRFIRANSGPWYKMNFDEANQFESLLDKLDS